MTDVETIARVERHRKWTAQEKAALLAEVEAVALYLNGLCFTLCGTRALARLGMPITPHPIL